MNYAQLIFIIIIAHAQNISAAVGCMDTSRYLQSAVDRKDLHYVSCDCACDSSFLVKTLGKCILCEHIHIPHEWAIMRHGKQVATTLQYRNSDRNDQTNLSSATQYLIKEMVTRYKKVPQE